MENNQLVSIITVSYNSEKTIEETIQSVLSQTYKNLEYIIVDGKSTDRTVEIIQKYEKQFSEKGIIYKWVSEKDKGIYDAMNKGIKASKGEIVGIINSDDWYEKDAVEKIIKKYNEKKFDMIYGDIRIIGENRSFIKRAKLTNIVTTRHWNHPTTFISRNIYDEIQYKLESINDDLDLILKIRKNKDYEVVIVNETLANFRMGGISNTKDFKKVIKNIKNRNNIYKNNGYSKLYYLDNFIIEIGKYLIG